MNRAMLISLVGVLAAVSLAARPDPFRGTWKMEAVPEGAGKAFKDTLTFKGQTFVATDLMKKGWKVEAYEDDTRGLTTAQFTATLKSPTEGEMKWTGSITAGEMRGTIIWKKKDGTEETYSYTASRAN